MTHSTQGAVTPLRQRMIEDMRLSGLSARTQQVYIDGVRGLAAHYKRSPDLLTEEEVRSYLLDLCDRGAARGTFKTNHYGIRLKKSCFHAQPWFRGAERGRGSCCAARSWSRR
jgi:hypothetical protein